VFIANESRIVNGETDEEGCDENPKISKRIQADSQ
jgi:hypothetical protein